MMLKPELGKGVAEALTGYLPTQLLPAGRPTRSQLNPGKSTIHRSSVASDPMVQAAVGSRSGGGGTRSPQKNNHDVSATRV